MKIKFISILNVFLALSMFSLGGCDGKSGKNTSWQKNEGLVWNTSYHIIYNGSPHLKDSVLSVLSRVGKSLSVFDSSSLVSRVNANDSTPVDNDFIQVYIMSKKINRASGGAFDPTLSPLITAWGFGKGHQATPDTARIDSLMNFVGIEKTHLRHDALIKDDPRIEFNFSAIAKGYGCDAIARMLRENNVVDFLIEIGGEISCGGKNPDGKDWRISIDRPIFSNDSVIHESQEIICVSDIGIATSGNYRNFHKTTSGNYGHTISADTGRPVSTDVISATVLAPTAMEADGLATAFMSMGSKRSIKLNESLRRPVMLVLSDSTVWISKEMNNLITK